MSKQVNIVAILSPAPGKKDRVLEILMSMIRKVEKEPGILQYDCFVEDQTGHIIFIEKYENKATLDTHMSTPYFSDFGKAAEAEGLLDKAPELKFLTFVTGLTSEG